jgi:hypothetical protein
VAGILMAAAELCLAELEVDPWGTTSAIGRTAPSSSSSSTSDNEWKDEGGDDEEEEDEEDEEAMQILLSEKPSHERVIVEESHVIAAIEHFSKCPDATSH